MQGFHCSSVVYFDPKKMDKKVEQDIDARYCLDLYLPDVNMSSGTCLYTPTGFWRSAE